MAKKYTIETYRDAAGEHRWRVRAANNKVVIPPEGYANRQDMLDTIAGLQLDLDTAPIVEVPE